METTEQVVDLSQAYDPRRNKKQILFHAAPETYKLFGGAMGGGKTASLINEGIQLNLDYPGNFGLLMRKTWPSFRDTVLPQLEKFMDLILVTDWNRTEKIITMINGSRVRYGGVGERPDDWEKFMSGEYGWIALDQSEQFTEKEFMMLATRLRLKIPGIRRFFLLSCNPNIGWQKERFIEKNLEDHIFIPSLPTDNIANLPSNYIPMMRDILTPKLIKALLEGDWEAVGEPDNVYSYLDIQKAVKRCIEPSEPVEIGADVARSGDDETTIILREGLRIRIHSKNRGYDTMRTTGEIWRCVQDRIIPEWKERIEEAYRMHQENPASPLFQVKIKVDADGVGGGVVDRLKEQKKEKGEKLKIRITILEIHGAAKAREPAKFKNLRAEIHWGLRELLSDLDLPMDRELTTQLMAIKYKVNSAGQIEIIPKDKIKEKLGRSPDLAEGVIYSLAEIKPQKEPRIW